MTTRRDALAARRLELVAQSDHNRAALSATVSHLEHQLALAELVVSIARRVHRHRVIIGTAIAWFVVAPRTARSWLARASVLLPWVIQGYRLFKSRDAARADAGRDV